MSSFLTHLRPTMASSWTSETEEEFVAMMESRPELFDTTESNFSNKTLKMNAWLEMAERLGISEKELKKKWDSLRTQYSRYTKMYGSGAEGRLCTARQQWILQRLKFLDPHIKRRSSYCTDLDYEVTVVENSCDGLSPAQVDVELEADSLHQASNSDAEINADSFKPQIKRPFQDEERVSDSPPSRGGKRFYAGGHGVNLVNVSSLAGREEEDEEGLDSERLRRIVCGTVDERKAEDCWDVFGRYVVSCLRSLDSSRTRMKAQNELCAVLQKHIEGEEEKEESSALRDNRAAPPGCSVKPGACSRPHCENKPPSDQNQSKNQDQDDLEPFLRSMAIIVKRLPESVRAEVKFRIHELVHRAEMKHLYDQSNTQNAVPPGQDPTWENGLNYNLI
ncbi:uncharacterized protein [Hoplias malabaricus]|uniref:uncharacterized protein n=1 Tax=Hoplias malabaricus TaxID=27720 RepID=UPI003462DE66